jgi:hypothetical protein
MRTRSTKSIAGLALALVTGFACAGTVTFDELPRNRAATDLGPLVESGGFEFLSQSGTSLFSPGRRESADRHGGTLESVFADAPLLVAKTEPSTFNLVSIDLGSVPADSGDDDTHHHRHDRGDDGGYVGSSGVVELVYWVGNDFDPAGAILLNLDQKRGLQTFELGLEDISLFGLFGVPFQLDNVVTTDTSSDPSPVPEPASGAAMLAGLAMLATLARRRRA